MKRLLENAKENDDAMIRHAMDPTIVVIKAPRRPVLKKVCNHCDTPKMVATPAATFNYVIRATTSPHCCLALKQQSQSNCKSITKCSAFHKHTAPEKYILNGVSW
jgi:hypothetical protein